MAHPGRRWLYPEGVEEAEAARMARETKSPETVWRLLMARGVHTLEGAKSFLNPTIDQVRDPLTLGGVKETVDRLLDARANGRLVGIHGDYDVDGMTSTALYSRVLSKCGLKVLPFVPHRKIDGYGVAERALDMFVEKGVGTVLTCDTGFSAMERVRKATSEMGLEVLVTDHHLGGQAPAAHAIVNPNREGEAYPFKGLCGVGVAFKVLQHLVDRLDLDKEEYLYQYLDLVALGTVCDVMPLVDENRAFVHLGVERMRRTVNPGLRALLKNMALKEPDKADEMTMAWMIGPRLNAVGRISDAATGLELLLTDDEARADQLAGQIEVWNTERKDMTKAIEEEAIAMVAELDMKKTMGIVLYGPQGGKWHHGVIGIVASRVVEQTGRPTFMFAYDETSKSWKGSGRAGGCGANLKEALDACAKHLAEHGGHAAAAGAKLKGTDEKARKALQKAFNNAVGQQVTMDDLVPVVKTDGIVGLDEITWDVYRKFFKRFAPFGAGNPEMTFVTLGASLSQVFVMGQDKTHLRLKLEQNSASHEAVFWGGATTHPWLINTQKPVYVDAAFKVSINTYRDQTRLQLNIQDIRPHGAPDGWEDPSAEGGTEPSEKTEPQPNPTNHGRTHPTKLFS